MYKNYRQHLISSMCYINQSTKHVEEWWYKRGQHKLNSYDIIVHYKPSISKRITSFSFAALKLWTIITYLG